MIIDAHAYFSPQLRVQDALCQAHDPAGLVGVLDVAGIDKAVISAPDWVDAKFIDADYQRGNRAIFEAAEAYPDRLVPLARIEPNYAEQSVATWSEWARHPLCKGLKLSPHWDYFPVNSKHLVDPLMAVCDELGLPVIFSTGYYPAAQPMLFLGLAEHWPDVRIGLLHVGLRFINDALIVAQRMQNVALICTPIVAATTIQSLVRELGADRVMFGSELPYQDPAYSLAKVRTLPGISDDEKALVLGGSAATWFGVDA